MERHDAMSPRPTTTKETKDGKKDGTPVYLNVYGVTQDRRVQTVNSVTKFIGGGAFHTAIEVYGREWSFGLTELEDTTGVCGFPPKQCQEHTFQETIFLGYTKVTEYQLYTEVLRELMAAWPGKSYHVLHHNCNHFCDDFATRLGVPTAPAWVSRFANASSCVVSAATESVQATKRAALCFGAMFEGLYDLWQSMSCTPTYPQKDPSLVDEFTDNNTTTGRSSTSSASSLRTRAGERRD